MEFVHFQDRGVWCRSILYDYTYDRDISKDINVLYVKRNGIEALQPLKNAATHKKYVDTFSNLPILVIRR
jgi:hypothetical protein